MVSDFIKDMYNYMFFVNVGMAKLYNSTSVISSDGEKIIDPFEFSKDVDGFRLLISILDSFENDGTVDLESTAHYGANLVRYFVAGHYNMCIVNPIQNSAMRKENIGKTKTDIVDTYIIAKTLLKQNSLLFIIFYDLDLTVLKTLGDFCQKTINQRSN